MAGSGLGVPDKVAQGLTPRAYIYTDRPAYRPGQQVALRGVVREVKDGQYANVPGADYRLEVTDSRGRQIVARHGHALGLRHLPRTPAARRRGAGRHLPRPALPAGQERLRRPVRGPVVPARADRPDASTSRRRSTTGARRSRPTSSRATSTAHRSPTGRSRSACPTAARCTARPTPTGSITSSSPPRGSPRSRRCGSSRSCRRTTSPPRRSSCSRSAASASTWQTTRDVYLDGESFPLRVTTRDAQGEPTGQALERRGPEAGHPGGADHRARGLAQDRRRPTPRPARASIPLAVDDEQGGHYVIRVAGTDRFGNPVVADRDLTISGKKDETKLRLLADRQTYKVGEEASVNLHSRGRAGHGAPDLGGRPDPHLQARAARARGTTRSPGRSTAPSSPTSRSRPSRMAESTFDEAQLDLRVERDLRVTVAPGEAARSGRARRSRSRSRPSTSSAARSRPRSRWRWSIGRSCGSTATTCRRSARSSTTRPAPGPSATDGDQHVHLHAGDDAGGRGGRRGGRAGRGAWRPTRPIAASSCEEAQAQAVAAAAPLRCRRPLPARLPRVAPSAGSAGRTARRIRRRVAWSRHRVERQDGRQAWADRRRRMAGRGARPMLRGRVCQGRRRARMAAERTRPRTLGELDERARSSSVADLDIGSAASTRWAEMPKARRAPRPAPRSGSSRRPTGTRASSPTRTARPASRFRAPMALSRVPVHGAGRHRVRHPRRPDDRPS